MDVEDDNIREDTEILESKWTSFRDVLLEIISDQPESLDSSDTESVRFSRETEIKILPSIEEAEAANYSRMDDDLDVIPINADMETNTNAIPIKKRTGILPTYSEDERKDEAVDLGLQLSLSADETNSSTVDIFRVWDLDIPAEEDDLIKQLNKAISETETSFQSIPLAFDDSTAWKDLKKSH
ncbi:hypothetical protein REPUB_Repub04eG0050500 [Reevesia pubescens]